VIRRVHLPVLLLRRLLLLLLLLLAVVQALGHAGSDCSAKSRILRFLLNACDEVLGNG
jgi:hypothetical protein